MYLEWCTHAASLLYPYARCIHPTARARSRGKPGHLRRAGGPDPTLAAIPAQTRTFMPQTTRPPWTFPTCAVRCRPPTSSGSLDSFGRTQ